MTAYCDKAVTAHCDKLCVKYLSILSYVGEEPDRGRKDLMEFAGAWKDFDVEEIIIEGREKFTKNAKILP